MVEGSGCVDGCAGNSCFLLSSVTEVVSESSVSVVDDGGSISFASVYGGANALGP